MNLTPEQTIEIATKVLKDINFWGDDMVEPSSRYLTKEILKGTYDEPHWLVSYSYGKEDFGTNFASVFIQIDDETRKVDKWVVHRGGSIEIEYDEANDKYSEVKRPDKRKKEKKRQR